MIVRHRRAVLAAVSALALGVAAPARALVVYDPTNYAQNLLQAARALQQIEHQISSLQNEATMLLNQARNLKALPLSLLKDLQRDMGEISGLLGTATRLAYDVGAIRAEFEKNYPAQFSADLPDRALTESARSRWLNALEAFRHVLDVQAGVVEGLKTTQAQVGDLVGASQEAEGALEVTQAGNQLLALQTRQMADLTALLAAQGRATALEQARQAEAAAEARERLRRFLAGRGVAGADR